MAHISIEKKEADIVAGLIIREIGEIARIKSSLDERGMTLCECGVNVRIIELKSLLKVFSEIGDDSETEDK